MKHFLHTIMLIVITTLSSYSQQINIISYSLFPYQWTTELCGPGSMTVAVMPAEYNPSLTYVWKCYDETCTGLNITTIPSGIQNGTSMIQVTASGSYFVEAYSGTTLVGMSALGQGGQVFSIVDIGGICSDNGSLVLCSQDGVRLRLVESNLWGQFILYNGDLNWQLNGVDIPGATGTYFTPTQPGSYRCRITLGCGTGYTDPITVTSGSSYSITIFGSNSVCNGNTTTLQVSNNSNLTYLWSTGATSSSINVPAGTYQVTATNINGCTTTASKTVTGHDPLSPQITASGATTICVGQSVPLTVSYSGFTNSSPVWRRNGSSVGSGNNYAATYTGSYTASVQNACGTFTSNAISVTVNSTASITPTLTANGPLTRCTSQGIVTLTASPSGPGYTYIWYYNGVAQAPTSSNVFSTGSTSTVKVNVNGNCSNGTSATTQITYMSAAPAKPVSIAGPSKVCPYQAGIVFSVSPVTNATGYNWGVPLGAAIVSGQGTTSISVNWGNKFGNVTVQSTNPCGSSAATIKKITKQTNCRVIGSGDENNEEEITSLVIFPNPASDEVQLQFITSENQSYEIQLRDISGKLISSISGTGVEGLNETTMPVSNLPAGMYLVFLKTEMLQEVKKLVVE